MANPEKIVRALHADHAAFKSFLVKRLGNEADAEDVLQNGLLRAFSRAGELKDDEKITAWFYRILRNAMVDTYRGRGASRKRAEAVRTLALASREDVVIPREWESQICACVNDLVPRLKPQAAELLRRVDLKGESVKNAARSVGVTVANASVILFRARKELRKQLEAFCGECASGGCLDCHCG